jgi:hypothetical protein
MMCQFDVTQATGSFTHSLTHSLTHSFAPGLTAMTPHNMDRGEMKNLLAKVRQWEGPTASRRASMASIAASAEGERRVSVSKNPTGNMANMASTKSIFSIAASAASLASGFSDAPKDHGAAPGVSLNTGRCTPGLGCLLVSFKRATARSSHSSTVSPSIRPTSETNRFESAPWFQNMAVSHPFPAHP